MRLPACLVLLGSTLAACANAPPPKPPAPPGQTFEQAVTMICDVDRLAGLSDDGNPLAIGGLRAAWLNERVENPDAIELKTYLSVKGPAEQAKMIRDNAKSCGVGRCALADSLEREGLGGLAP